MHHFIVNRVKLHQIENQLIHNIILIMKEEKSPGAALELNNAPSNPRVAVILY
jgi:hypothetical protein